MLPASTVALHVVPVDLKTANEFVRRLHRHSRPVVGHRFSVGRIGLQDDLDAAMTDPKPAEPAPATPSTDP